MRIKDLTPEERPREKMRDKGVRALTSAELLAVLLGSGSGAIGVTDIARELLQRADGKLALLSAMPQERLMAQPGIGEARALTIAAALELGRRAFAESTIEGNRPLTSPLQVYRLMLPVMRHLDHEECWGIFLNRACFVLGKEMITSGSLESTLLDPVKILRRAIEKQATSVILVHNHPSGSPLPGSADCLQTDLVRKALGAVGIGLTDHIIVAEDSFYSFSEDKTGSG